MTAVRRIRSAEPPAAPDDPDAEELIAAQMAAVDGEIAPSQDGADAVLATTGARPHTVQSILARWREEGPLVHQPTPFTTLNELTRGGFVFGRRVTIVGPPGVGKTAVEMTFGVEYVVAGLVVGVLAVDEDPEELLTRFVQMLTPFGQRDVEARDARTLDEIEMLLVRKLSGRLLIFDASTTIEAAAAATAAAAARAQTRAALLIDSIQTARSESERDDSGDRERIEARVAAIRRETSARRLITIATSEMNRAGYASSDVAFRSSELATARGSSAIEYSAHTLIALRSVPGEDDMTQVIVAKNRGGRRGEFFMRLDRTRHELREVPAPDAKTAAVAGDARRDAKVKADAERVFQAILKKPGAGSKYLREGAGLRLGPTALGDALRVLVDDARIANRPTLHGTREDAHYFVVTAAQTEGVSP